MKKFNIYANIKGEEIQSENGLEFNNEQEALTYAEHFAYDLYYFNPMKDMLEIMKELNVDEDMAEELFKSQMMASVEYRVEEVIEGE